MAIAGNTIAHEALVDQNAVDWRRQFQRMLGYDFVAAPGSTAGAWSGGVARSGDCAVSAGAGLSVNVAAGFVAAGENTGGTGSTGTAGVWTGYNDATLNIVLDPADAFNPRLDRIGFGIRDAAFTGATNDGQITFIKGAPAGVPVVAAVPATYIAWVDLATVLVPAGAAVPSTITDYRKRLTALGGIAVCTSTARPATNLWEGLFIYETDTDAMLFYDGSTWKRTADQIPHSMSANVSQAAGNRNSTTYAAIPTACQVSFTKHRADTTLFFEIQGQGPYTSGGIASPVFLGANYDGVAANTVQVAMLTVSAGNTHQCVAGVGQKTGLAAGAYTVAVWWKGDGVNQINFFGGGQEYVSLLVTESL